MATYDLKYPGAAIDAILDTAYDLQNAGYIFRGLASEYSNTPTERSWVLAGEGETGHGFTSPVPKGYIGVCVFNGTSWTGKLLKCVSIDSTPTSGSTNAVSSGGAYASISQLAATVNEALDNLTFTDSTPSAFLGEYIKEKVSTTAGGIERILTFFNILAATAEKAGLLSAADKAKLDALWSSGYQFVGIATPSTTPVSTTSKIFYIATEAGTYFNSVTVTQGINIIYKSGDAWSVAQVVGIDNEPTAGSDRLVKSGGVFGELALGAVYDVSAKNPTAGPNSDGKWESLSALLSDANLNTLIPTSVRKGGMSIKYVQSSDNKYVQYRLMANAFSTTVSDWQGVDDEPTAGSNNLVKSGGVVNSINQVEQRVAELGSEVPEFGGKTLKYEVYEAYIKPCALKKGVVYRVENQTSNTMSINLYSANERSSKYLVQEIGTISGGSYILFEVESDNVKYIGGWANTTGYIAISVFSDIRKDLDSAALIRKRTHSLSASSESEKRIWGNLCFAKDTIYLITINVVSLSASFTFRIQDKTGNVIVPSVTVSGNGVKEYTFECKEDYDNLFGRFYFNGAANVNVSIVEQKIRQNSVIELDSDGIHTLSNLDSKTAELELNTILTCNGKNYRLSGNVNMKNNVESTGTWLILNLDDSSLNVVDAFEYLLKNNEVVIAAARFNYGSNYTHLFSFNALFRCTIDGTKQDKAAIYNTLSVLNDSENLFDVTRAIKGRFDGFGKIIDEGIYDQWISDYIPCHGKEYISSNHAGRGTDYIVFYDGELKVIQTVLSTQKAFEIPSNAYYVRMTASIYNSTGYIAFVNNAKLSADDYVPYKGYGWVANYVKNLSELNLVTKEEILTVQATEGVYAWEYQYTGVEHSSTKDKFIIHIKGNKLKVRMSSSSDDAPVSQMFINGNGCDPTLTLGKVYDMTLPDSYDGNEDVLVGFYVAGGKPNQTLKFEIYTEGSRLVDEQVIRSKAFCDLFNNTQEADSYLYFTDPHTAGHGFNINRFDKHIESIKKIADGNPIQMVMCGGDWLNNEDTQEEACESLGYIGAKMKCFNVPSCLVVGNHDTNYLGKLDANSENGTGRLLESTIGNLWFGHYNTFYAHKTNMTRFYVLDTGTDSEHVGATELTLYQIEQLKWLCESLISNNDIHVVLSFHIYFVLGEVPLFIQQIINVAVAYNNRGRYLVNEETFDFSSTEGTIHCCICGHSHSDFVEINNGIPIIGTILGSDFTNTGQMLGDGTKVNLDLVLLDYTHRKFKSIRIGDGENREIDIL